MLYKMHKLILKMEDLKMLAVKENKMELQKISSFCYYLWSDWMW